MDPNRIHRVLHARITDNGIGITIDVTVMIDGHYVTHKRLESMVKLFIYVTSVKDSQDLVSQVMRNDSLRMITRIVERYGPQIRKLVSNVNVLVMGNMYFQNSVLALVIPLTGIGNWTI
jgi:hypothetical protein